MISNKFVTFAILAMVANVSTRPVDLGQDQSALTSSLTTPTESVATVTSTRMIATGTPALSTPSTVNTPAPTSVIPAWMDWATYVLSHPSGYIPPTYILPVPTLGAATSTTSDLAQYLPTEAAPSPVPTASAAQSPRVDEAYSHIPNSTGLPTTESPVAATAVETVTSSLPAAPTTTLPGSAPSISAPAENDSLVAQPSTPASVSSLPASMPSAVAPVSSSPATPVTPSTIPDAPAPSAPSTPAVPVASA